jgi:undecaprenyl-diphosphatase
MPPVTERSNAGVLRRRSRARYGRRTVSSASVPTTDSSHDDGHRHRNLIVTVVVTFLAVLVIALAVGLILESLVAPVGSTTLDRHITDWFFTWRTNDGLGVMTRVSWIGGPILAIPVTVAATLGLVLAREWRLAQYLVITVVGAVALSALAKAIIDPRRPPGELGLRHPFASSFPSGHAAAVTAIYVGLAVIVMVLTRSRVARALMWSVAVVLIVAVGVARVYLAVHWTTDVLTGILIGALWAIGSARALRLHAGARSAPP